MDAFTAGTLMYGHNEAFANRILQSLVAADDEGRADVAAKIWADAPRDKLKELVTGLRRIKAKDELQWAVVLFAAAEGTNPKYATLKLNSPFPAAHLLFVRRNGERLSVIHEPGDAITDLQWQELSAAPQGDFAAVFKPGAKTRFVKICI